MSEKGTLCHARQDGKWCEGISGLHGLLWGEGQCLNRAGRQCLNRAIYAMHDKMGNGVRGFLPAYMGCYGGGGGGGWEIRGLEGREKAFCVFLSGNT